MSKRNRAQRSLAERERLALMDWVVENTSLNFTHRVGNMLWFHGWRTPLQRYNEHFNERLRDG